MTVYDEIKKEKEYQDKRWGTTTDDTLNTPRMWVAYITRYSTKWMVGTFSPLGKETTDNFRKMMVKVATLAVSAIESLDRQRVKDGKTFYE